MDLARALRQATGLLTGAGLPSPRADATLLAAHLLGLTPGQVQAAALAGRPAPDGYDALVARRAAGEPVQHITGVAGFGRVDVQVGPGVFVPRPETELLVETVLDALTGAAAAPACGDPADGGPTDTAEPQVVDLCTGSGAIALAVQDALPRARVHAVELDPAAHAWAARNLTGLRGHLVLGDATDTGPNRPLAHLDGRVDVVVANPPYVPDGDRLGDAAGHDPRLALDGGPDGTAVPLAVAARAALLLRPGGLLVMEHDERRQPALLAALAAAGWSHPRGHHDLAGRPRYLTAHRPGARIVP